MEISSNLSSSNSSSIDKGQLLSGQAEADAAQSYIQLPTPTIQYLPLTTKPITNSNPTLTTEMSTAAATAAAAATTAAAAAATTTAATPTPTPTAATTTRTTTNNLDTNDIPVNPILLNNSIPLDPSLLTNTTTTTTTTSTRTTTTPITNTITNKPSSQPKPQPSPEIIEQSLSPFRVGKNWACRICGRQFTRRFNCTTHERTHLDLKERAQFQCRLCERAFTRRHDLERHIHSVHPGHTIQPQSDSTTPLIVNHSEQNIFDLATLNQLQIRSLHQHHHLNHHNQNGSPDPNSNNENLTEHHDHIRILMIEQPPQTELVKTTTCDQLILNSPSSTIQPTSPITLNDHSHPPTAILTSGSIRGISQGVERVPLDQISEFNPSQEPIFKFDKKWACGTCGRIFVRRNNCKAHEATHRDIREHQCPTCSRSFSRKHDLERHMSAVHPGVDVSEPDDEMTDSSRRKRRKQAGRSEEWTAIDPFILGLAVDRIRPVSGTKGGSSRGWEDGKGANEEDGPSESGVDESHDHRSPSQLETMRARAVGRTTRVDENELVGPARRRRLPPSTTGDFNIFETFDPLGGSSSAPSLSDSNSLPSPPRSLGGNFYPSTSTTHPPRISSSTDQIAQEVLDDPPLQLDPRLLR